MPNGTATALLGAIMLALTFLVPRESAVSQSARARGPVGASEKALADSLREQAQALRRAAKEHGLPRLRDIADRLERLAFRLEKGTAGRREALERLAQLIQKIDAQRRHPASGQLRDSLKRLARALGQPKTRDRQSLASRLRERARALQRNAGRSDELEQLRDRLRRAAQGSRGETGADRTLRQLAKSLARKDAERAAENMRRLADQVSGEDEKRVLSRMKQQMQLLKLAGTGPRGRRVQRGKRRAGGLKPGFSPDGDLFGKKKTGLADPERTERAVGKPDAGASKGRTVTAASDDTRPSVGPQPGRQTLEEVAQEFLEREEIPLGQRYRVQRYFDLIRPE